MNIKYLNTCFSLDIEYLRLRSTNEKKRDTDFLLFLKESTRSLKIFFMLYVLVNRNYMLKGKVKKSKGAF